MTAIRRIARHAALAGLFDQIRQTDARAGAPLIAAVRSQA
jgi:hypothetical protein